MDGNTGMNAGMGLRSLAGEGGERPPGARGDVPPLTRLFVLDAHREKPALPWLDRSKVRSGTFRPIFKQFYILLLIDVVALFFVGIFEKPAPLPASIADSVLTGVKGGSAVRIAGATAAEPSTRG